MLSMTCVTLHTNKAPVSVAHVNIIICQGLGMICTSVSQYIGGGSTSASLMSSFGRYIEICAVVDVIG